jgi:hypothetical protein
LLEVEEGGGDASTKDDSLAIGDMKSK